jgi:alpha(1,3/1,4) fucosyltransferase
MILTSSKWLTKFIARNRRSSRDEPRSTGDYSYLSSRRTIAVCAVNVWPSFSLKKGFWNFVLRRAFGSFEVVDREASADFVLASVFPHRKAAYPEKTIALIWENIRPNYEFYRFSISSDIDGYQGRNLRLPNWCEEIAWSDDLRGPKGPAEFHGYEERLDLESLLMPQEASSHAREKFCCLVTSYREGHRALAAEALRQIGPVDVFGNVTGTPLCRSKYELLRDYRFNLCFENSIFPGYYTEKPVHAWAAGCIPLYFSDPYYSVDFNPRAMINRIMFPSLQAFVDKVAEVNASDSLFAQFQKEPLLSRRPTLDPLVSFLRAAIITIASGRQT